MPQIKSVFNEKWLKMKWLKKVLCARPDFSPYPRSAERPRWQALPADLIKSAISEGEQYLNFRWPDLPATLFMDYSRTGNRNNYQTPMYARRKALASLVIAECVEGEGRFIDDIINGIWTICEESFWGVPAHNYDPKFGTDPLPDAPNPIIDLFAAETAALISWTDYLLHESLTKISRRITDRMQFETYRRIIQPFLTRDDFWWMGSNPNRALNNWTPWCVSNCLAVTLIHADHEDKRLHAVQKSIIILERFLSDHPADGGCDEGTSYWGRAAGSLFDCLELLFSATQGAIDLYDHALIQEMGRYVYRMHIDGNDFVNFADGSAKTNIDGALVYMYGKRIGDENLASLGAFAHLTHPTFSTAFGSLQRPLRTLFHHDAMMDSKAEAPYIDNTFLPDLQVMTARENSGSPEGFFIAMKGGHNAESHNHNDIGQMIVYHNGKPVLIDVGVGTYTAKTFGPDRYDIWTMQSMYHNLPTVNGIQQRQGLEFQARDVRFSESQDEVSLSMDISAAYPEEAGIITWNRHLTLSRQPRAVVTLKETFELEKPTDQIELSLMTPSLLQMTEDVGLLMNSAVNQEILLMDGKISMTLKGLHLATRCKELILNDPRLTQVWGERLYRIILSPLEPASTGTWEIAIKSKE